MTAPGLLARTINVGLDLTVQRERAPALDDTQLDACAQAGFTAIRIGVSWVRHPAPDTIYGIDRSSIDLVKRVVGAARRRGLAVVIANVDDPELMANPPRHRARFLAQAAIIATALRDQPPTVLYEPMAEPHADLDPVWNGLLADLIDVIRRVDPTRTLVVGPRSGNRPHTLTDLALPHGERNVVISVHQQWPLADLRHGPATTWDGSPPQVAALDATFRRIARWAEGTDRTIFIGDLGATDRADTDSHIRWTRWNRELAERHGFGWGYSSLASSFALYDLARRCWHPALLDALLPERELPFTD